MVTKDSLTDLEGVTRVETPLGKSNNQKRKKLSKKREREKTEGKCYTLLFFFPQIHVPVIEQSTCQSDMGQMYKNLHSYLGDIYLQIYLKFFFIRVSYIAINHHLGGKSKYIL